MSAPQLYLASQSPRRAELLQQIDVAFEPVAVAVDESPLTGEAAADYVQRLARAKAVAGWEQLQQDAQGDTVLPVLGADTSVVLGEQILGKPRDREDAVQMLQALSGRCHQVMTAVHLYAAGFQQGVLSVSEVCFRTLSREECEEYWHTGEPQDKAGAYAIQGRAAIFIETLRGSYSGVVGLPLLETHRLLCSYQAMQKSEQS